VAKVAPLLRQGGAGGGSLLFFKFVSLKINFEPVFNHP